MDLNFQKPEAPVITQKHQKVSFEYPALYFLPALFLLLFCFSVLVKEMTERDWDCLS